MWEKSQSPCRRGLLLNIYLYDTNTFDTKSQSPYQRGALISVRSWSLPRHALSRGLPRSAPIRGRNPLEIGAYFSMGHAQVQLRSRPLGRNPLEGGAYCSTPADVGLGDPNSLVAIPLKAGPTAQLLIDQRGNHRVKVAIPLKAGPTAQPLESADIGTWYPVAIPLKAGPTAQLRIWKRAGITSECRNPLEGGAYCSTAGNPLHINLNTRVAIPLKAGPTAQRPSW